jgi:hypothetical protein
MPFQQTFDRIPALVRPEPQCRGVSKEQDLLDGATVRGKQVMTLWLQVFSNETSIVSITSPSGTSVPLLDVSNHPRLPPFRVAPGLWRKMGKFSPRPAPRRSSLRSVAESSQKLMAAAGRVERQVGWILIGLRPPADIV